MARSIQQAFLPKEVPTLEGWQISSLYQPAREVGGDFYDFHLLSGGRLGLVVGDATGKGVRVQQRKWALWGFVYLLPFTIAAVLNPPAVLVNSLLVVGWIASSVHAFRVRREYLMRLEALQHGRVDTDVAPGQRVDAEHGTNAQTASPAQDASQPSLATSAHEPYRQAVPSPQAYEPTPPANTRPPAIDLNSASEQELASLSGVGIIVAKRAVSLRESRGGFRSVEDFGEALNLKPHVVERIRPLVYASPPPQSGQSSTPGRVVDF